MQRHLKLIPPRLFPFIFLSHIVHPLIYIPLQLIKLMRPRHGKKKSMDEIQNPCKDSANFPLPSSTRFQTEVDLQQFSCCLTLRFSIHDKIKKLQHGQKMIQKEYSEQVEYFSGELMRRQAKNNQIRFEIEELQRQTKEIAADIDTIVSFAERKAGKLRSKVKGTSKQNILKKEKSDVSCQYLKNSSRFIRFPKNNIMV